MQRLIRSVPTHPHVCAPDGVHTDNLRGVHTDNLRGVHTEHIHTGQFGVRRNNANNNDVVSLLLGHRTLEIT